MLCHRGCHIKVNKFIKEIKFKRKKITETLIKLNNDDNYFII